MSGTLIVSDVEGNEIIYALNHIVGIKRVECRFGGDCVIYTTGNPDGQKVSDSYSDVKEAFRRKSGG